MTIRPGFSLIQTLLHDLTLTEQIVLLHQLTDMLPVQSWGEVTGKDAPHFFTAENISTGSAA